jgi:hypothetical protein
MPLTKASFAVINVAGTITSTTVGNTTSIPSFTFDQNGVISAVSNTAISGAGITANTVANSAFQTGSVESYMRGANLDFGMRNRIINGAMVISQNTGTSSVTVTTNQYTLDRWRSLSSPGSKYSVQQNAGSVTPPAGFTNYFGVTSLSAYSVSSGDYQGLVQKIEGYNIADLTWGTASARPVTLSFWVRSSLTGTFGGSLFNAAHDRSYPFTYTISSANTWEQKSITIAGDTTGTWLTDNSVGIQVNFGLGVGSGLSGTAGAWSGSQLFSATGATSVVGTNGATFYVTGVQLEEGSQATSFEYREYGAELRMCQRYFIRTNPTGISGAGGLGGAYFSSTDAGFSYNYPVTMRAAPTVTRSSAGGNGDTFWVSNLTATSSGTSNSVNPGTTGMWQQCSAMTSAQIGHPAFYNGSLQLNAEL